MSEEIWLLNVSGYGLIAVICGLIVVEELGVPMPFAPGDLMLVVAGASIASAHLNPLIVAAGVYVAAVAGATAGREIYERIGVAALPRLVKLPLAGRYVDALGSRLRRRGAIAVFLGRITPGLRVVTTMTSGLVAMQRRTFAQGLLPGVAAYQAVFLGLGFWLGPRALSIVERHAPNQGEIVILAVAAIGLLWAGHMLPQGLRALAAKRNRAVRADDAAQRGLEPVGP